MHLLIHEDSALSSQQQNWSTKILQGKLRNFFFADRRKLDRDQCWQWIPITNQSKQGEQLQFHSPWMELTNEKIKKVGELIQRSG